MNDGEIALDTEFAKFIGFTSDKFGGYLWKTGGTIAISAIMARQPGRGHFRDLLASIESKGFKVKVPTPLPGMRAILEHYGFVPHVEPFAPELGDNSPVDVWERPVA